MKLTFREVCDFSIVLYFTESQIILGIGINIKVVLSLGFGSCPSTVLN